MNFIDASTTIKNLKLVEKCQKFNKEFDRFKKPIIRSAGHYYYEKFFGKMTGIFKTSVCTKLGIERPASDNDKKLYSEQLKKAVDAVIEALKNSINESISFANKQIEKKEKKTEEICKKLTPNKNKIIYICNKYLYNSFDDSFENRRTYLNNLVNLNSNMENSKKIVDNALNNKYKFKDLYAEGIKLLWECLNFRKILINKQTSL